MKGEGLVTTVCTPLSPAGLPAGPAAVARAHAPARQHLAGPSNACGAAPGLALCSSAWMSCAHGHSRFKLQHAHCAAVTLKSLCM